MICKLSVIILHFAFVATYKPIIHDDGYDHFNYDCNFILSSMEFFNSQRCVQFIFGNELYSLKCINAIMENSENVTFYVRSLAWLINRNVYMEDNESIITKKQSTKYCENFLILLKNFSALQSVLKSVKNNVETVTIFPYSKLYFLLADENFQLIPRVLAEVSRFFYENGQFGFVYEFNANRSTVKLQNFLSLHNESKIRSNLLHPIINRKNDRNGKEFRLSFYNCYPFVIYKDEENLRFDGVEYRLIHEVIKNWKIKHILRDESKTGISPWITMFEDLENRTADLAMCSIWLQSFEDKYDISTYYNHECSTLMVPKPKRLSEMTAIYKTLTGKVWLIFGLLFFATGILLRGTAMIDIEARKPVYVNISGALLDVANIATQHGIDSFQRQQNSTKFLLMSWIFLSSLVSTFYTTIYTSRLTKPGFTRLINTIEDFIENEMFWGTYHRYTDVESVLNMSPNPAYQQLRERISIFKNREDAKTKLATGKFGVYAGITNAKYFVTYDWNEQLHLLASFRLMKRICLFNYYTVFGLQKFSPYTELFSHYAHLFQEYGITNFWFSTIYRDKVWMNKFFEDHAEESNEATALRFASISGALLVLLFSHFLSTIIFICEFIVKRLFISKNPLHGKN